MERKKAAETFIRLTSTHCGFAPQEVMSFVQNCWPEGSESRLRKSL
jgi:hypothetical protein